MENMTTFDKKKLDNQFTDLFTDLQKVINRQKQQKLRGLNDYNLLTAVLKASDEVKLHSRFIYSMINNKGVHYQSTLFLDHFIKDVLESDIHFKDQKIEVFKEWQGGGENGGVDLFITDKENFFIIENKLYAADQYRQIARYVRAVKEEYKLTTEQLAKNVFVYYLSPMGNKPDSLSLGKFVLDADKTKISYTIGNQCYVKESYKHLEEILDGKLTGDSANFKLISYKKHIMKWVDNCLKETENLTNLNQAFLTYKDVVERVSKQRKSKVETAENYLSPSLNDGEYKKSDLEKLLLAREVEKAMPSIKGKLLCEYFNSIVSEFEGMGAKKIDLPKVTEFTEDNCKKWFIPRKKDRSFIGVVLEVNEGDVCICVLAASVYLHVGLISKTKNEIDNPELIKLLNLEKQNWGPKWYSRDILRDASDFDKKTIKFFLNKDSDEREDADKLISKIYSAVQDNNA